MFHLSQFTKGAQEWFHREPVFWPAAVSAAIDGGVRNRDDLADLVFFMHHKERMSGDQGRALTAGEPRFAELAAEWKGFRTLVDPMIPGNGGAHENEEVAPSEAPVHGDVIDRTGEHELNKGFASPERRTEQIRGIVLHQTGAIMSSNPARWDNVAAHAGVLADGRVVLINELRSYVMHANLANAFSLGIEIHGLLPGLAGKVSTMPAAGEEKHPGLSFRQRQEINFKKRTKVTPDLVRGARRAVQFLVEQGRAMGCSIDFIWAHRQFSSSRSADPGDELWKEVALWAVDNLGLRQDPHFTLGSGRAVPREWGVPASAFDYRNKRLTKISPPVATMARVQGINSRKKLGRITVPT